MIIYILITLLFITILGVSITVYVVQANVIKKARSDYDSLVTSNEHLKEVKIGLEKELDILNARGKDDEEKRSLLYKEQFKLLSLELLEEQRGKNAKNIDEVVKPFKDKLDKFNEKIGHINRENIEKGIRLEEKIKNLIEKSTEISNETNRLTNALTRKSKVQGDWGENILLDILDISGLEENINYFFQKKVDGEVSYGLTDVVVKLSNGGSIIIDSKVSLKSYVEYVSAETPPEKKMHLEGHLASIKSHIKTLSSKEYNVYKKGSLDFVIMFIPIESAYMLALNSDVDLINDTFSKHKIAIATPSSLIPILRTVKNMYNIVKQDENSAEIAKIGGEIYDRFSQFIDHNVKVKSSLESALKSHDDAMKKLGSTHSGGQSIYTSVEKMKKLGAKSNRDIKNIDLLDS